MAPLDILYLALATGFLILVGFASYTLLQVGKTLKEIQPILEDIRNIIDDIRGLKDSVKSGFGTMSNLVASVATLKSFQSATKNKKK